MTNLEIVLATKSVPIFVKQAPACRHFDSAGVTRNLDFRFALRDRGLEISSWRSRISFSNWAILSYPMPTVNKLMILAYRMHDM